MLPERERKKCRIIFGSVFFPFTRYQGPSSIIWYQFNANSKERKNVEFYIIFYGKRKKALLEYQNDNHDYIFSLGSRIKKK